ncbi:MAG TPA: sodium-translocating pyrophosphatase, partial [Candidatus Acetothermia bacterium]|nr:sodium-translocating pyrophosphatase [Candidatus Acetothermia bacterium]
MLGAAALVSLVALASSAYATFSVARRSPGSDRMAEIQRYIRDGAWAFMIAEAKVMIVTMFVVAAILWAVFYWDVAVAFVIGSTLAMAAGFLGMNAATLANARTTEAAQRSIKDALRVAFSGGSVMGMAVAGLAVGGLVLVIVLFRREFDPNILHIHTKPIFGIPGADVNFIKAALIVSAYSAGASLVALFDRVGGGIYTKAADMAADLVGKVELKIPEDDPRNPATIADNVGDNVGDVGGLGADLLESFIGSVIASIVIALYVYVGRLNTDITALLARFGIGVQPNEAEFWWFLLMPVLFVTGGIVACLIAIAYIRFSRRETNMQGILMNGTRIGAILTAGFAALITWLSPFNWIPFFSAIMGIASGVGIGFVSEYYTSSRYKPTRELAKAYQSGPAIGVTEGMAVGMLSALWPCLIIAVATVLAYQM